MRATGSTLELRACPSSRSQLCSVLPMGPTNCASFRDDTDIRAEFGISYSLWLVDCITLSMTSTQDWVPGVPECIWLLKRDLGGWDLLMEGNGSQRGVSPSFTAPCLLDSLLDSLLPFLASLPLSSRFFFCYTAWIKLLLSHIHAQTHDDGIAI